MEPKLPPLPLNLDHTPSHLTLPIKAGELVRLMHQWGREIYAAQKVQHIPANFTTHRTAWRAAISACLDAETAKGDHDQAAYWQHEMDAYDRAFARLLDNPEPVNSPMLPPGEIVAWQNRHAPDNIVEGKYAPDASDKWVPLGYVLTRQAAPQAATAASEPDIFDAVRDYRDRHPEAPTAIPRCTCGISGDGSLRWPCPIHLPLP